MTFENIVLKLCILIAVSKTRSCNYSLEAPDDER